MEERLQKLLSAAGVCSRRTAEGYIAAGRVTVNGFTASLGQRADLERDEIRIDGRRLLSRAALVYLMLNKPRGYVTTLSDEKGRHTAADLVKDCGVRVYPVGRLDLNSEGLLLMTNDGELAQRMTHPSHEVSKTYHVSVSGAVEGAAERLSALRDLEGEVIRPAQVSVLRGSEETAELSVTIHEGKNRQVRRMCAQAGLEVLRLMRVREGSLELDRALKPGQWRPLAQEELLRLTQPLHSV